MRDTGRWILAGCVLAVLSAIPAWAEAPFAAVPGNPIGIACAGDGPDGGPDQLFVTSWSPGNLHSIDETGVVTTLTVPGFPSNWSGIESYLAISAGLGGWVPGQLYATFGGTIYQFAPDLSSASVFVSVAGTPGTHTGITFDRTGVWNFDMIISFQNGPVWRVDPSGTATFVANTGASVHESPRVIPNDPGKWGAFAGCISTSSESLNKVIAVCPDGSISDLATSITSAESSDLRPVAGETTLGTSPFVYFASRFNFGQVWGYEAAVFPAGSQGDMFVSREFAGGITQISGVGVTLPFEAPISQHYEGSNFCFVPGVVDDPCDPDPRTQGYWHRQCLGVPASEGGIDPGRNGRGPSTPIEPDFDKLMTAVSDQLGLLVFENGGSCAGGMDAVPASDPCERAIKQFTALLFNLESGKLTPSCPLDLAAEGCASENVGDLVDELSGLINTVDGDSCQLASECAAAVNEGTAVTEGSSLVLAADTGAAPTPATRPVGVRARQATRLATAPEPAPETAADAPETPETTDAPAAALAGIALTVDEAQQQPQEHESEPAVQGEMDGQESIRKHLAVLANTGAPQRARAVSMNALLNALSGGYGPEVRLQIVEGLVGKVDVGVHSLLASHLDDIRSEASDFGQEDLVKKAERLLDIFSPSTE